MMVSARPGPGGSWVASTGTRTTSASRSTRTALTVTSSGSPGPTPTPMSRFTGHSPGAGGGEPGRRGRVAGQARRVPLGEAAAEDQPGRPLGQVLLPERVERGHPGPGRFEQFGLFGVAEGKGRAAGHGNHWAGVVWFAWGFPRGTGPGGRA